MKLFSSRFYHRIVARSILFYFVFVTHVLAGELILMGPAANKDLIDTDAGSYAFFGVDTSKRELTVKHQVVFDGDNPLRGVSLNRDVGVVSIYFGLGLTRKVDFVSMKTLMVIDSLVPDNNYYIKRVNMFPESDSVVASITLKSIALDKQPIDSEVVALKLAPAATVININQSSLSGLTAPFGISEVALVEIDQNGVLSSPDPVVPKGLPKFQMSQSDQLREKELILVTATPSFACLLEFVLDNDQTSRELLIGDLKRQNWQSYLVPGTETTLQYLSGWLVGTIADKNPKSDYPSRMLYQPPSFRDEIFILEPIANHSFVIELKPGCEVLWIDSDSTVFYRITDSLYKARIENNDFLDRQLLLTDPKLVHIHWAFRTTE